MTNKLNATLGYTMTPQRFLKNKAERASNEV